MAIALDVVFSVFPTLLGGQYV